MYQESGESNFVCVLRIKKNTPKELFQVLQYLGKLLLMRTFCTMQLPDAHLTTFCFNFLSNNQTKRPHFF